MLQLTNINYADLEMKLLKDNSTARVLHQVAKAGDRRAKEMVMLWGYGGSTGDQMNDYLDKTREKRVQAALVVYGD